MSYAVLVIGESGSGKTSSLRNFDPQKVLLIQPIRKPLPFRSKEWKEAKTKGDNGCIFYCDNARTILAAMLKTQKPIIILDDFQYLLLNMEQARRAEKGWDKYDEIKNTCFDILKLATNLAPEKRVYILGHSRTDENGKTRIMTLGKAIDSKIKPEGMVTFTLETTVSEGEFYFITKNNGTNTAKTPMGMFDSELIENDLNAVDKAIVDYYGIEEPNIDNQSKETK